MTLIEITPQKLDKIKEALINQKYLAYDEINKAYARNPVDWDGLDNARFEIRLINEILSDIWKAENSPRKESTHG